jgi:hypothetical protein
LFVIVNGFPIDSLAKRNIYFLDVNLVLDFLYQIIKLKTILFACLSVDLLLNTLFVPHSRNKAVKKFLVLIVQLFIILFYNIKISIFYFINKSFNILHLELFVCFRNLNTFCANHYLLASFLYYLYLSKKKLGLIFDWIGSKTFQALELDYYKLFK